MTDRSLPSAPLPMANGRAMLGQRWRHLDKSVWVWFVAIAVLLLLIVNPLLRLLISSFQSDDTGAFTLGNYVAAYSRLRYLEALGNSLVLGSCAASLCLVFGVPLAWAVSRTDMPFKGLIWISILGTFIIPPYLGAVGWILLAGPNAGWLNRLAVALTGSSSGPFNIYSMPGLVSVSRMDDSDFLSDFSGLMPASEPKVRIREPNSPLSVMVCPSAKTPRSFSANRQ